MLDAPGQPFGRAPSSSSLRIEPPPHHGQDRRHAPAAVAGRQDRQPDEPPREAAEFHSGIRPDQNSQFASSTRCEMPETGDR
jgi:hypothetical protein